MKKHKIFALLLPLFAANMLRGQGLALSFSGENAAPDSIVEITALLPGSTRPQTLTVGVTNGWAVMDGDIVLGRIENLQQKAQERGLIIEASQFRWPDGVIPCIIGAGFTNEYINLIKRAINYVNGASHVWIRTKQPSDTHWIEFTPSVGCASLNGMQPLSQVVWLKDIFAPGATDGCDFATAVHEISHAAGLWHEQSREDRDQFVTINWGNIAFPMSFNFWQNNAELQDVGPYDFESVMHYGPFAFSGNGLPTITANGGETFGSAPEYSLGDVAAMNFMYPAKACASDYQFSAGFEAVVRPLHFEASGEIISGFIIPPVNEVVFDAGLSIVLQVGFRATASAGGGSFRAVIDGCAGAVQSLVSPEEDEWIFEANHRHPVETPHRVAAEGINSASELDIAPNPFSGNTTFAYTLVATQEVSAQVFNSAGKLVATPLHRQTQVAGEYRYRFEAANLPTGIYLLVLQKDGERITKRMVLAQ